MLNEIEVYSMLNIIDFKNIKKKKEPVVKVCKIVAEEFENEIILGKDKDGAYQMVSTYENEKDILWNIECAKYCLFKNGFDEN